MTHIDSGELLAFLDDELSDEHHRAVGAHLEACEACAATLAELALLSGQLTSALESIDRPAPEPELDAIIERSESRGQRSLARGSLFKAAAILLTIAGASAAAIPGSPVNEWLVRSLSEIGISLDSDAPPAPSPDSRREESGVAVAALDGRVRISLLQMASDALIRVTLVDYEETLVRAAGARYRIGPGWIQVVGPASGDIRIQMSRSVSMAIIDVNGEEALVKRGADLRLSVPATDSTDSEIVFRARG
jgi:hypothetical protein